MATERRGKGARGEVGEQLVALAEQLGRLAGTVQGTAEDLLTRPAVADQLERMRDNAAQLLRTLGGAAGSAREVAGRPRQPARRAASADAAHAPGKRHRKPAPSVRGAKKSDERIPKMRTAAAVRRRRKFG